MLTTGGANVYDAVPLFQELQDSGEMGTKNGHVNMMWLYALVDVDRR